MKYSVRIVSDIIRDGLGAELLDENGNVIAEVFRCDRDKSLTISTFNDGISLTQIEEFIQASRKRLEPFEDGTPLPSSESTR